MNDAEARELAEAHWTYVEKICRIMYVDAFIHGIKHGQDDIRKNIEAHEH